MQIDQLRVPKHIAIIMDGNGRWAKKRHLPKIVGYREGVKRVEEIIRAAKELGIKTLTLYTFSTENWKRPKPEVDALMRLLEDYLDRETERLAKEGVRFRMIGRISHLSSGLQLKIRKSEERTINNRTIFLNMALNYGGRAEIVDATKKIAEAVKRSELDLEDISEESFPNYLYTVGTPDPELLIRTSGEMRVSNFLLWQVSYSEIYVTEKFWPDFRKKDLEKAVIEYQKRERRYGE